MEMQDFLRYFPPMAALSVASFSGSHLLRDPGTLPQDTQAHDNAALLPPAHALPSHPATPTTPAATTPPMATPEVTPPEGTRVDAESFWLASNEPYPIPELPPLPSLSEIINQLPLPSPAQISLDPALIHVSVQVLSDSPLEAMIAAEVASRGATPEGTQVLEDRVPVLESRRADLDLVAGVANPVVVPPETRLSAHGEALAPAPRTDRPRPGIAVAALPHPETGSAQQLLPLQAVTAFGEVLADPASTVSWGDVSTETQRNSPGEMQPERPLESTPIPAGIAPRIAAPIDIPVPPPEPELVTDSASIVPKNRISTPDTLLPAPALSPGDCFETTRQALTYSLT